MNKNSIAVIDIESACDDTRDLSFLEKEIIQIGIAFIDLDGLTMAGNDRFFVKPRAATISEFCTKLTGITQDQVDKGKDLADVFEHLRKTLNTGSMIMASYGDYDRDHIKRWCETWKLRYPFGPRHINIKTLTRIAYSLDREPGLDQAAQMLWDGPPLGRHHNAGDDANTASFILRQLLRAMRQR